MCIIVYAECQRTQVIINIVECGMLMTSVQSPEVGV